METALSKHSLSTDCQRDEKIFRTHHLPTGRHRLHEEPVPAEILDVITIRDDLRKRDPTSHELPRLNYDIQNRIYAHKRQNGEILLRPRTRRQMSPSCGEPLKESMAEQNVRQRTKQLPSMEARSHRRSKQLAVRFNQQFKTSKLGRHTFSSETRYVTRETRGNPWRWHRHSPRI